MIKQSISWWCYANRGIAPDDLLRQAREIGFDAVELLPNEMLEPARKAGLAIASHGGHQSLGDGLNQPANHERIAREIRDNLRLATKHGIANLIVFSGNRRDGLSDDEGAEITAAGLRLVAKDAESAGVNLVIELLNSKVDHKGYQCDRTPWARRVCELVGSPRVKMLYDIYHMQIMEGDVIRTIRENHALIGHYHTAGNPGRNDLDDTQEINYPPICRAIAATGYDGYIGHEFIPKGDPIAALRAAFDLVARA